MFHSKRAGDIRSENRSSRNKKKNNTLLSASIPDDNACVISTHQDIAVMLSVSVCWCAILPKPGVVFFSSFNSIMNNEYFYFKVSPWPRQS